MPLMDLCCFFWNIRNQTSTFLRTYMILITFYIKGIVASWLQKGSTSESLLVNWLRSNSKHCKYSRKTNKDFIWIGKLYMFLIKLSSAHIFYDKERFARKTGIVCFRKININVNLIVVPFNSNKMRCGLNKNFKCKTMILKHVTFLNFLWIVNGTEEKEDKSKQVYYYAKTKKLLSFLKFGQRSPVITNFN